MFSTVADQRNQLLAMQERQRRTERERDTAVAATSHAEQIATEAVRTTEQVHGALQAAKTEVETLQQATERSKEAYKKELAAKQERIDRLFDSLNAFKAKAWTSTSLYIDCRSQSKYRKQNRRRRLKSCERAYRRLPDFVKRLSHSW